MKALYECPYCTQVDKPHVMSKRFDGAWYRCNKCGHTIIPSEVQFHCSCLNCSKLQNGTHR